MRLANGHRYGFGCWWLALAISWLWLATGNPVSADELGFKVPPNFVVELFAGDELAHDIFSMTVDSRGRVVVAGKGYVKILHDDNGDGRADRASLFSSIPKSGAHGLCFDGNDLLCTGDNALMKLRDTNGDGVADGEPEIWAKLEHREHGANGIVKAPDGWFYVICGNDAGVTEKHATSKDSPIKRPICGALLRFSPDGKQCEIMAHGFRNPYDLDFNEDGRMFTVDADGERDQYLPWYIGTRLFDIAAGQHHGWVNHGWQNSWNRPSYFFDNTPPVVELGRGSPTGLVVYRRTQFPSRYRGSVFSACWSLGRVYHLPLWRMGATYESKPEIFLETTGQVGFAPVDLAVNEAGDLFIAVGGRGTRGSVFRVRYVGAKESVTEKPAGALTIIGSRVLQTIEAARQPLRKNDKDMLPLFFWDLANRGYDWGSPYSNADRRFRDAMFVMSKIRNQKAPELPKNSRNLNLSVLRTKATSDELELADLSEAVQIFRYSKNITISLDSLRVFQLGLGDIRSESVTPLVYAGYQAKNEALLTPEFRAQWEKTFAGSFPDDNADINRELARTMAMLKLDSADAVNRFGLLWTKESRVEDDIHYLIALSLLSGERKEQTTKATAAALVQLHAKMIAGNKQPSRNWPARVSEAFVELCKKDAKLPQAVIDAAAFGLGDHSLFVATMPPAEKLAGTRKLIAAAKQAGDDFRWSAQLVELVGELPPDEARPVLRDLDEEIVLQDAVMTALAKHPDAADRGRFVAALSSVQPQLVARSATALVALGAAAQPEEISAAVAALRQACAAQEFRAVRTALTQLLATWSGQTIAVKETDAAKLAADYQPWFDWFAKTHPAEAKKLNGLAGADAEQWQKRLAKIDWATGDATRGKKSFEKRACARCHSVSDRIGPDLAGAAARFARADLFTAIIDPNKEVAPLYQTSQVFTRSGKVYTGLVVYESPESTLLQTSPDTTVRVTGEEITGMKKSRQSIMPVGLLNNADDQELADLYSFLQTLKK